MKKLLLLFVFSCISCEETPKKLFQLPTLDSQETCVKVKIESDFYYEILYYDCQNNIIKENGFSSSTIMVKANTMLEYKGDVEFTVKPN